MRNIIVITGHGNYASGIKSCIEMICGKHDFLYAIDFNGENINEKYDSVISSNSKNNVLFICDMIGGTPFKECSKKAISLSNVRVVAGINVGAIVQIIFNIKNYDIDKLIKDLINFSNRNIIMFNNEIKKEKNNFSSGI